MGHASGLQVRVSTNRLMVSASVMLTHSPRMVSPSCGAAVARVMSESKARRVLLVNQ